MCCTTAFIATALLTLLARSASYGAAAPSAAAPSGNVTFSAEQNGDDSGGRDAQLLEADYYIQNVARPDQCIEAGPISGNDTGRIFYNGTLVTHTCRRYAAEQQWHFKPVAHPNGTTAYSVNISNVANLRHREKKLNAVLLGQFVWYWPEAVLLLPVDPTPPVNGSAYYIKVKGDGLCYEGQRDQEKVLRSPCASGDLAQEWRLALVTFGEIHS